MCVCVPCDPPTGHYDGMFKDGKRNGPGKYVYKNGDVYEGEYLNDLRHGRG